MVMTPQRWSNTNAYLAEVFGCAGDDQLESLMPRAVAAGLPDIAVSPDVGRLLTLLCRIATAERRSTRRILEVGTLAGYSGIHLARGLPPGGTLITIEAEPRHAAFARAEFDRAGVGPQIDLVTAAALDALPRLARALGPQSLDLAFLDAVKREYAAYLDLLAPMLRPGGLLIADNALGAGWWIDEPAGSNPDRDAMDAFNRALAVDPRFDVACIAAKSGLIIGRRTDK